MKIPKEAVLRWTPVWMKEVPWLFRWEMNKSWPGATTVAVDQRQPPGPWKCHPYLPGGLWGPEGSTKRWHQSNGCNCITGRLRMVAESLSWCRQWDWWHWWWRWDWPLIQDLVYLLKFSNLNVLRKGLRMQDWIFRLEPCLRSLPQKTCQQVRFPTTFYYLAEAINTNSKY